jgi:hypothetical protein
MAREKVLLFAAARKLLLLIFGTKKQQLPYRYGAKLESETVEALGMFICRPQHRKHSCARVNKKKPP